MSERSNPRWEEIRDQLHAGDAKLSAAYEGSEPAYLVAREVLKARAELGISQAELARRMGTTQSVVSRLENMDSVPNLRTVVALARALGRQVELRFVDPEAEPAGEGVQEVAVELARVHRTLGSAIDDLRIVMHKLPLPQAALGELVGALEALGLEGEEIPQALLAIAQQGQFARMAAGMSTLIGTDPAGVSQESPLEKRGARTARPAL